jgi:DNA-binding LytR/AlgR family response regulator
MVPQDLPLASEIQALDAVKRDQDDGVIVTTFNDRHQALKTQITELEVALAAAIKCRYNYPIILIPFNSIKRLYLYLKRLISLLRRFYCRRFSSKINSAS